MYKYNILFIEFCWDEVHELYKAMIEKARKEVVYDYYL